MQLCHVTIREFRSIFPDERDQAFEVDLAEGMTALVGRNNCGKSNILRAVALALDPESTIDPAIDLPVNRQFTSPVVELGFALDPGKDEALLELYGKWLQNNGYESDKGSERRTRVRFNYRRDPEGRYKRHVTLIPPDASLQLPTTQRAATNDPLHDQVIEGLLGSVRVVTITSGQGLEEFLEGNFREALHTVLRERLEEEIAGAIQSRQEYIEGLEDRLLEPLRILLGERVGQLFEEIGGLALHPEVPDLEETLSRVAVSVTDAVETPLEEKGTGVRGGVLVALLNYLADNTSAGLVFLIEEPEAFLHPAAQEDLRDTLELIAERKDVTTVVTSHSPFIASRRPSGRIFALAKDKHGRTRIEAFGDGDSDHAHLIGGLLRPKTFEDVLASAMTVEGDKSGVLIVEGDGDRISLELAADRSGCPELISDIEIRPTGGTSRLVLQAVIAREALKVAGIPVAVLLDDDEEGRSTAKKLKDFSFDKKQVLTYGDFLPPAKGERFPYEAEDMWAPSLIQAFVDKHGDSVWTGARKRPDDAKHYDFDQASKKLMEQHLRAAATAEDATKWIELIQEIRSRLGLEKPEIPAADPATQSATGPEQAGTSSGGTALVLNGSHSWNEYTQRGLVSIDVDTDLHGDITHVGFYCDGEVKPLVPAVRRVYRSLTFSADNASAMQQGTPEAVRVGDLMLELLDEDEVEKGSVRHVLLLSSSDANDTVKLDAPIENTKTIRGGRAVAWIVAPTLVPLAVLSDGIATTAELDEAVVEYVTNPRESRE